MSSKVKRKLAAIMFTDIVGYTAQMSKDEDKAFALIKKKRDLLLPLLEKHEGKLIKEIGDGTMTRYFKAGHAIDCATTFQGQTGKDLNIRAGIHMGEVIIDKEDVFGDVVNIAARLESFAVPGSVFVSKETIDKLEILDKVELISLGLQSLKGVGRLIEVFAIKAKGLVVPNPKDYIKNKIKVHSDDEVPSIAIIPFENKGKEEDAFYAYSISADLISDVSAAGFIKVASLKDIEKLDFLKFSNNKLSKKLFVRYLAQGVLWKIEEVFQLSVELYDTKTNKIVWIDRWEEKWENLPSIKLNLSDSLLKILNTLPIIEKKAETIKAEAYELYLRGKYKYEKRKNMNDTNIARSLLEKAIQLDNNLIIAKHQIGISYVDVGEYDKAMEIFSNNLKHLIRNDDKISLGMTLHNIGLIHWSKGNLQQSFKFYNKALKVHRQSGNERSKGVTLNNIGLIHWSKGQYDQAKRYYLKSFEIVKKIDDKSNMAMSLTNLAIIYAAQGDYEKCLDYHLDSYKLRKATNIKHETGHSILNIGIVYSIMGKTEKALSYYQRALKILKEINDKVGIAYALHSVGSIYYALEQYNRSIKFLKQADVLQQEIELGGELKLWTKTYLFLSFKKNKKKYKEKEIYNFIKSIKNIEYNLNFAIYELTNDKSFLQTAYKQIQDNVDSINSKLRFKFLNYPIPKAIVEEWNQINN